MACQTFKQLNQTWRARYSNRKIKHEVTDIQTIKSNMTCQIVEEQKMTYQIFEQQNQT